MVKYNPNNLTILTILLKVYAGIVPWESGERVVALRFTARRFEEKFRDLMKILDELQQRNALEYHQLVHNMFLKVACVV